MDYKIITSESELLAERESWNSICANMINSSPFQTWEWNYIWWKNNEPIDSLYVIKAFENKKVYAYAPFVLKDNRIEFIGGRDIDYGRFIVYQKEITVIEGILNLLLEKKFQLNLQEMASSDTQLHMVQKVLSSHKKYLCFQTTRTMGVDVSKYQNFDEYISLVSQSMRSKTIKAGLKQGVLLSREELTDTVFEEMADIFNDRQDERGGNHDLSWAIKVVKDMGDLNLASVYIARKDGNAIGFLVELTYLNKRYIWLLAFKTKYRECYPGQLLMHCAIKDGFNEGAQKIDFMRGDYDFKARWECSLDTNYTVCVYKSRFQKFKKKLALKWRPRIKKLVYGNKLLKRLYKKHAK